MHDQGMNVNVPTKSARVEVDEDRIASAAREQTAHHSDSSRRDLEMANAQREALMDALRAVETRIQALGAAIRVYDEPQDSVAPAGGGY